MTVNVYYGEKVVGRVEYNGKLDYWDGHNWTSGSTGRHLGITKLKKPVEGLSFVLIYGTQWYGERDRAELVDKESALQAFLRNDKTELLEKYFPDYDPNMEEIHP